MLFRKPKYLSVDSSGASPAGKGNASEEDSKMETSSSGSRSSSSSSKDSQKASQDTPQKTSSWVTCPKCDEIIHKKELLKNLMVCPKCGYHFRIGARTRIAQILDENSFKELFAEVKSDDPLKFVDLKPYSKRLEEAKAKSGEEEAVITGTGKINGIDVAIGVMDFFFMGGSMGSAVGEKLTRLMEYALEKNLPVVIVSASGGARMQEGILSLMQMAKTSAAVGKLRKAGIPYISVLTDPTTGGVSASFAFLGDVIIAEPGALIGFAGPRVIEQTIKQKLPEGFQRAEFLLEHGMVDMVVDRRRLKETLARLLEVMTGGSN